MRQLFVIDKQDYAACTHTFVRDSARGIVLRNGKVAMMHSLRDGYYKFPGGGIEAGETTVQAMIREVREEAGLIVRPETVREYGCVHRIQCSPQDETECFIQDNYYYLCEAEEEILPQQMEAYEAAAGFTLEFAEARRVIRENREKAPGSRYGTMMCREARVLEMLIEEGILA